MSDLNYKYINTFIFLHKNKIIPYNLQYNKKMCLEFDNAIYDNNHLIFCTQIKKII